MSTVFDFASLNSILFLLDHEFILLISIFAKFSASLTDSPLVINRSSAKAMSDFALSEVKV